MCERAHAWASLELDGELSQLERALLRAHLRRCEGCALSAAEMRAFTSALREAPLELPSRQLYVPGARTSGPKRRVFAARLALAATLALAAAGLGVLAGSLGQAPATPTAPTDPAIALLPSNDELRDVRRLRSGHEPLGNERLLPRTRLGGV
jgi:anti-sigma factor RsiW